MTDWIKLISRDVQELIVAVAVLGVWNVFLTVIVIALAYTKEDRK